MENPSSRDASLNSESNILPMQFMLTTCIKVEAMNRVAYVAGFVSIKTSLNTISPNWYSHNDKNANIDVGFRFQSSDNKMVPDVSC